MCLTLMCVCRARLSNWTGLLTSVQQCLHLILHGQEGRRLEWIEMIAIIAIRSHQGKIQTLRPTYTWSPNQTKSNPVKLSSNTSSECTSISTLILLTWLQLESTRLDNVHVWSQYAAFIQWALTVVSMVLSDKCQGMNGFPGCKFICLVSRCSFLVLSCVAMCSVLEQGWLPSLMCCQT